LQPFHREPAVSPSAMKRFDPIPIILFAPAGLLGTTLYAADYMTPGEAQRILFPDATGFEAKPVAPTREQIQAIQDRLKARWDATQWGLYAAKKDDDVLGYVLTDAVIGKSLFINYAVGFSKDGAIKGVEILSYRETHGGEVRQNAWRKQFVGKSLSSPLRLGDDIRNISGATLSCAHLTEGVRRLATFVALALPRE